MGWWEGTPIDDPPCPPASACCRQLRADVGAAVAPQAPRRPLSQLPPHHHRPSSGTRTSLVLCHTTPASAPSPPPRRNVCRGEGPPPLCLSRPQRRHRRPCGPLAAPPGGKGPAACRPRGVRAANTSAALSLPGRAPGVHSVLGGDFARRAEPPVRWPAARQAAAATAATAAAPPGGNGATPAEARSLAVWGEGRGQQLPVGGSNTGWQHTLHGGPRRRCWRAWRRAHLPLRTRPWRLLPPEHKHQGPPATG